MIIEFRDNPTLRQRERLITELKERKLMATEVTLKRRRLLVTSGSPKEAVKKINALPGVKRVVVTTTEFQLSTREFQKENTVIDLGDGVVFGTNKTIMMAGPCSVESEKQIMETAAFLTNKFQIKVLRGGAFKPRTSPYSFQGLEEKGLTLLAKARKKYGVKIITEVKDTTHLEMVAEMTDIVQIGTKSMYNFSLLKRCGKLRKPILLKRGFMTTIKEFLQAADFIMANGNHQVILCERGLRNFEPMTRFSLDVCGAAVVKSISHLPMVIDPSHAIGIAKYVPEVASAGAALSVDGLLVETHPQPEQAQSDKEQALSFEQFAFMMPKLEKICAAVGRKLI